MILVINTSKYGQELVKKHWVIVNEVEPELVKQDLRQGSLNWFGEIGSPVSGRSFGREYLHIASRSTCFGPL